jgi:PleD family two-component response regulator
VGADVALSANILKRIHDALVRHFEQQGINGISFSAGFAELHHDDIGKTTKEQIIDTVDGYLYQAKRSGKKMLVSKDFVQKF